MVSGEERTARTAAAVDEVPRFERALSERLAVCKRSPHVPVFSPDFPLDMCRTRARDNWPLSCLLSSRLVGSVCPSVSGG